MMLRASALTMFGANLVLFANAMRRLDAPDGWPRPMRVLALCGAVTGVADLAAVWLRPAGPLRQLLGVGLAAAATTLFARASRVALAHRFAVAFADVRTPSLVLDGPYRWLAHPLYVSYGLNWAAAALATEHWVGVAGMLLMCGFYVVAARKENVHLRPLRRAMEGVPR